MKLCIIFLKKRIIMTTIVSVRRNGKVVIGGDGQVSLGNTVMKGNARKVHRIFNNKVLAGFAGSTADAFTLLEIFESQLKSNSGSLEKAAVGFAKEWRTDKSLRKLEAMLIVADSEKSFIISGAGDVVVVSESEIWFSFFCAVVRWATATSAATRPLKSAVSNLPETLSLVRLLRGLWLSSCPLASLVTALVKFLLAASSS